MRRKLGALVAALAVTAGAAGLVPTPAAATAYEDVLVYVPPSGSAAGAVLRNGVKSPATFPSASFALPGHFKAGSDGQVFVYNPGVGSDGILNVALAGAGTSNTFKSENVGGTFQPFVGDFDGNSYDDIFWYAPGAAKDYIWFFAADGTHSSVDTSVGGTYKPIVIFANNDSRADVIWYAPGAGSDSMWLFGATPGSKTVKPLSIGGDYTPSVGRFGWTAEAMTTQRLIFFNPSGTDYIWGFDGAGNHTSATLPTLDGNYRLLPGQYIEESYGDLLFYGPGALAEKVYHFGPGPLGDVSAGPGPNISGTYATQLGDFDSNGFTDIAFFSGGTTTIWKAKFDGTHTQSVYTGLPSAMARVTRAA